MPSAANLLATLAVMTPSNGESRCGVDEAALMHARIATAQCMCITKLLDEALVLDSLEAAIAVWYHVKAPRIGPASWTPKQAGSGAMYSNLRKRSSVAATSAPHCPPRPMCSHQRTSSGAPQPARPQNLHGR